MHVEFYGMQLENENNPQTATGDRRDVVTAGEDSSLEKSGVNAIAETCVRLNFVLDF